MSFQFVTLLLLLPMVVHGALVPDKRESPPVNPVDALNIKLRLCEHDGVVYRPGEYYQETPCKRCQCTGWGEDFCSSMACGIPFCPDDEYETREGACCPSCVKEWPNGIGPEYPVPVYKRRLPQRG